MINNGLKYVIKDDGDASRKRRVYFTCHPADFDYFKEISNDILELCNCTVFYHDTNRIPDEDDFEDALASMNLVVIAVSSNTVFGKCFGADVVFPMATKKGIPVLPILVERGIEEDFNKKFGNLQCLCMFQEKYDPTAVPYKEKLANYLSEFLSSDVSVERLRAAFDASIFLSYRKKDRSFAQKLMELIHENEACRNIAIWYDEFLIPGEDFNSGIRCELEQSAIFVLVVTPHTVEDNNYILLTEYPMATELEKLVLPFEMVPTDKSKLITSCPGIPSTMPTVDGDKVREAILSALEKMGISQTENTAEREFLIGLAYLKGICVEKNSKVGFSMILSSAEQGVPDAVRMASVMYRNGEGVEMDLATAELWQRKVVDLCVEAFDQNPCEESAKDALKSYFTLADIRKQNKDTEGGKEAYKLAIELCARPEIKDTIFAKKSMANAYELAGLLRMDAGDYGWAKLLCFDRANEIKKELYSIEDNLESGLSLVENHLLIAECCACTNNIIDIKESVLFVKRIFDRIGIDSGFSTADDRVLMRVIVCNNKLGHFFNLIGKWEEAFIVIGNNILLANKLAGMSNSRDARRQLMLAHKNDGEQHAINNVPNHLKAASSAYCQAASIASQLLEERRGFEGLNDLGSIYHKLGVVYFKLKDIDLANQYFEKAFALLREAHGIFGSLAIKRSLMLCCKDGAVLCFEQGQTEKAFELIVEGDKLGDEAVSMTPLAIVKTEQAQLLEVAGNHYKGEWDFDAALIYYRKRHELLSQAAYGTKMVGDMKRLAQSCRDMIGVCKMAAEFFEAKQIQAELDKILSEYSFFIK